MDSFEARLQYLNILKNLNKTLDRDNEDKKFQDPIQFYLGTYMEHYEDYHFCLLDYIKKLNTLDRLPCFIYYTRLIDQLHELNNENSIKVLNNVFIPSLLDILKEIMPVGNIMSMTNLNIVTSTVNTTIEKIKLNDIHPDETKKIMEYFDALRKWQQQLFDNFIENSVLTKPKSAVNTSNVTTENFDTSTIVNRMERDRERHKRLKQQNWQCERGSNNSSSNNNSSNGNSNATLTNDKEFKPSITSRQEFLNKWNTVEELNSIDLDIINDCNEIAHNSYCIE